MAFKERYRRAKAKLLADSTICLENRNVFRDFFDYEEYKLQRLNDLRELDEPCYKTLYEYTVRLRTVNRWFENRPWQSLTREDIKTVYDALENGQLLTLTGRPFMSTQHYYKKILKSKPFELAGKAQLAREVIQFPKRQRRTVRYITRDAFLTLVSVLAKPKHLLLFWLAWDIGENIDALLQLQKKDFTSATDPYTGEPEYRVNLPEAKIKRSRQTRTEPTLYSETVRYCAMVLPELENDDEVFPFGYRQAVKLIHNAGRKTGVKCMPDGERVRWKDLRSGMACHLLSMGWQPHEVNLRLGHKPHSDTLNAYINYLAIDRHRPKQKLYKNNLEQTQHKLTEARMRERLAGERNRKQQQQLQAMRSAWEQTMEDVRELRETLELLQRRLFPDIQIS